MKKILLVFALTAFLLSCSSGSPKQTAKNFTENVAKGKIDEAKKYSTESTGKLLDMAAGMGRSSVNPDFKFVFIKDSVADNRAWVMYKDESKGDNEQTLTLVKIDGDWKVDMDMKK